MSACSLQVHKNNTRMGYLGWFMNIFLRCFILKDPSLGFLELLQSIVIVFHGDILKLMALMLKVSKLLIMAKDIGGLCPIVVNEMFLQFINRSIILYLQGLFQEHLYLLNQFEVSTFEGCETIPFGIKAFLKLQYQPLKVVKPSLLESRPFSSYNINL